MEWVKTLVIAVGLALVIRWGLIEPFKIPSGSMQPTLNGDKRFMRGDRVFVNKWSYGLRVPFTNKRIWQGTDPQRWDIVVFKAVEEGAAHKILVKRVVGMPGERIQIQGGQVYADGVALELPADMREAGIYYTPDGSYGVLPDDHHALVPEGHYLMLGDNSAHSRDGRWFGFVPNGNMLGRVYCIWWTPAHIRDVTGFTGLWWWRIGASLFAAWMVVRLWFGRSWKVRLPGLEDALRPGDHIYVNRLRFGLPLPFTRVRLTKGRAPERGELVVYHNASPETCPEPLLIGRVAGLPGERVNFEKGQLRIDNDAVTAPALAERRYAAGNGEARFGRSKSKEYSLVPDGHYFLLAGEEADSVDSRALGWVPRASVVGTVSHVWWPLSRWGKVWT